VWTDRALHIILYVGIVVKRIADVECLERKSASKIILCKMQQFIECQYGFP